MKVCAHIFPVALLGFALSTWAQQAAPDTTMYLDVVVTDAHNQPVSGLTQQDFQVAADGHPVSLTSLRAVNGLDPKADPPVQLSIIFDLVNLPVGDLAFARQQVEAFLRQNNGNLALPTTIYTSTYDGIQSPLDPSGDGRILANELDKMNTSIRPIGEAGGYLGEIDRLEPSIRNLMKIIGRDSNLPGRKIVVWIGPGWPLLDGPQIETAMAPSQRERNFKAVQGLVNGLRTSRICLESASLGTMHSKVYDYLAFLKPLKSPDDAGFANLGLRVLVTHGGGQVLLTNNDLVDELNRCVRDANFYTVSFVPHGETRPEKLHTLKMTVNRPGMTARAASEYYDPPAAH